MFKTKFFKLLIITILIIGIYTLINYHTREKIEVLPVQINGRVLFAEIADSQNKKRQGISYRHELSDGEAILFVYDDVDTPSIPTNNTFMAFDIIWLNNNFEVSDLTVNVKPCEGTVCPLIEPKQKVQYALVVPGNFSKRYKVEPGDIITIANEK